MDTRRFRTFSQLAIILILLASTYFLWEASGLRFDYDFENFFPEDDPETTFFEEHRDRFGSDNDVLLIGIIREGGVFDQSFLQKVDALTDSLATLEHVEAVRSPTKATYPVRDPLMGAYLERPFLHIDEPSRYGADSARIFATPSLVGSLFSKDGQALCIIVHNEDELAKEPSDRLADELKGLLASYSFEEVRVAGRIVGQQHYIRVMKREFVLFLSLAFVLVLFLLIFLFRTWWGVLVPMAVVLLAVVWILGIMGLLEEPVNLLLSVLPTILFVVGTSDVVHLLSKYQEELQDGKRKTEALSVAYREIGLATFLTSVTTAAGFLTLLTAGIEPIREFGVYTALGVFIAFFLAFTFFPALLLLMRRPSIGRTPMASVKWERGLRKTFLWVLRERWALLGGTVVLVGLSFWGIHRVDLNNHLLEDLEEDDPVQRDFRSFEERFSGVRPFEMAISVDSPATVLDRDVMLRIDTIQDYLQEEYGVQSIASPHTLFSALHMAWMQGDPKAYRLPRSKKIHERIRKEVLGERKRKEFRALFTEDLQWARVTGRMGDLGSKRVRELNDSLHRFIAEATDTSLFDYKLTGSARLIDRNNKQLSGNMMNGLMIAFGVIALIVFILFRSFKMVFAVLLPNVLPLLMVGGVMGWAGIPLKVSTSIIFTIAFGIAVDDTIHFTNRLKMELGKGKGLLYALKRSYLSTGKAILLTTLILCGGFFSLTGSDFVGASNIGLLVTLSLFFAVLADLTLLPILLVLLFKRRELNKDH